MDSNVEDVSNQLSIVTEEFNIAPPPKKITLVEAFFKLAKSKVPNRFLPLLLDFEERKGPLLIEYEKRLTKFAYANYLQQKTGIHSTYWSIGGGVVGLMLVRVFFKVAASLLANFIGFVYPAYCSIKAIESKETEDDTQWLSYWTVYASFNVVEYFSSFILRWIPFYYFAKISFLVWCFLPSTKGSTIIYQRLLRPLYLKYHAQIDRQVERGTKEFKETLTTFSDSLLDRK